MGNEVPKRTINMFQTGGLEDQRDGDNFPSKILVGATTPYRKGILSFSYTDLFVFIRKGKTMVAENFTTMYSSTKFIEVKHMGL